VVETVVVLVIIGAFVGVAERVAPGGGVRSMPTERALRTDAAWIVLYTLYFPSLAVLIASAASLAAARSPLRLLAAAMPLAVKIAVASVLADAAAYLVHRVQHAHPALWRTHSVHHSSETLRWWSAFRSHPLDTALAHAAPVVAAGMCGFGPATLVRYLTLATIVTVFAHADVHVPSTPLGAVLVTPAFHRAHHGLGNDSTNFALVFPFFDLLGRTAARGPGARTAYGTESGVPRHGLWPQLGWGFGYVPVRATPITNDTTLATPLVTSATAERTRLSASNAASPAATSASVITSAAALPARRSSSG